jgi:hypothetical protein
VRLLHFNLNIRVEISGSIQVIRQPPLESILEQWNKIHTLKRRFSELRFQRIHFMYTAKASFRCRFRGMQNRNMASRAFLGMKKIVPRGCTWRKNSRFCPMFTKRLNLHVQCGSPHRASVRCLLSRISAVTSLRPLHPQLERLTNLSQDTRELFLLRFRICTTFASLWARGTKLSANILLHMDKEAHFLQMKCETPFGFGYSRNGNELQLRSNLATASPLLQVIYCSANV